MGSIRQASDFGSRGIEGVELIRCVDVWEHQIHKFWCLGSDGVNHEDHPTLQRYVGAGTVGQFMTNYLAENGRIIPVISQLSINRSVEILGIPADAWGYGLPFIDNIQAPNVHYGWADANNSNQNLGVTPGGPYRNVVVAWVSTVPACSAYMPSIM